jgi:hypothetical protein
MSGQLFSGVHIAVCKPGQRVLSTVQQNEPRLPQRKEEGMHAHKRGGITGGGGVRGPQQLPAQK